MIESRSDASGLGDQTETDVAIPGERSTFVSARFTSCWWEVKSMPPSGGDPRPASNDRIEVSALPRLNGVKPSQVASFILDVGGHLVDLEARAEDGRPLVVYTFEVAGKRQSFEVAVCDGAVESIAQLMPEAAQPEAALHERLGITFQTPGAR